MERKCEVGRFVVVVVVGEFLGDGIPCFGATEIVDGRRNSQSPEADVPPAHNKKARKADRLSRNGRHYPLAVLLLWVLLVPPAASATGDNSSTSARLNVFLSSIQEQLRLLNVTAESGRQGTSNLTTFDFPGLVKRREILVHEVVVIVCYTVVVVVSVFGNLLVCNVVLRHRCTTYVFIANLAVSDLLMTVLNIPFNVARVLLDHWPFGNFMCSFVPLVQVTSVYVSTFTMTCIALDRYQVIMKPLRPRMGATHAVAVTLVVWVLAVVLSLPHGIFNEVSEVFTYRMLVRCRVSYPPPEVPLRRWVTLVTFVTQYVGPLSVTGAVYGRIVHQVWSREVLGAVTEEQLVSQSRSKRKTIKMLVIVVILFAICWLPLNLYHVIIDFSETERLKMPNSTVFFLCHWLAMSSVCYNPFVYCWLNENFRAGARLWLACLYPTPSETNAPSRLYSRRSYPLDPTHSIRTVTSSFPSHSSLRRGSERVPSRNLPVNDNLTERYGVRRERSVPDSWQPLHPSMKPSRSSSVDNVHTPMRILVVGPKGTNV